MYLKSNVEYIWDIPLRIRSVFSRRINQKSRFTQSSNQSDSEITQYSNMIERFIQSESSYRKFRRYYNYRLILEHVDFKLGKKYLTKINGFSPSFLSENKHLIKNDIVGSPRIYRYPNIGAISPTTLRYVSVMLELKEIFNLNRPIRVAEIGVGYGGQFVILNNFLEIESFSAFDLPEVLTLAEKYASSVSKTDNFIRKDIYKIENEIFDLVISNYAFSELPIQIQREYLAKLILNSKMGYMIMNSGKSNVTGRSIGKIDLKELCASINSPEILEEIPLTGPDNYLLIWGRGS